MQKDFPADIVNRTAHRPWPLPQSPWVMTQSWHNLLFAHWPVDEGLLRSKIPPGFPLDTWDGQAWLGVVPFRMTNVAPRFVPALPMVSEFAELNVRTYVTIGGRPGVYFFSLDAASALAVAAARSLLHLPYFAAQMAVCGLYTALRSSTGARIFLVACDMPFVQEGLVRAMLALSATNRDAEAVVLKESGASKRMQPLHAVYAYACLPAIERALATDDLSLRSLLAHLRVLTLDADTVRREDPRGLSALNVNTPEDWREALRMARELEAAGGG